LQPEYGTHSSRIEDFIALPVSEHPVVMKLSMNLNVWGTVTKSLFRLPKVTITLIGTAGYLPYRLAPATLQDGMFMNFLPIRLQDMEFLMNANQARGTMYGIKLSDQGLRFYNQRITIEFYEIPDIWIREFQLPILSSLVAEPSSTPYRVEYIYEYPENRTAIPDGTPSFLIMGGWALDTQARDVAGGVYLEIDGNLYPAYYGFPRDDVVKHFGASGYRSGFQAGIPVSAIGKGSHTLALKVLTKDGKRFYAPPETFRVEIK
jgi:hypothetical protein